jgi:hypothetical protein
MVIYLYRAPYSTFSYRQNYEGHFRSFVCNCLVITKYKITTLLIFLNVYTYVLYSMQSPALSTHVSYLQLQFYIHPCSDNVKRQWQQCWNHLLIQTVYSQNFIPHVQTTSHYIRQDLESRADVPTPPSPFVAPEFAHHNGDEVLNCPGAKWHHVQAVLIIYSEQPASPYPARVRSNNGH